MRIQGPNGTALAATTTAARRTASGTFAPVETEASRAPASAAALRTVGGIDALIALQGLGEPGERRRHAVKRGRVALDALDELKIGLLGGTLSAATMTKLKAATGYLKDGSGDSGLDGVLAEIDLRVAVELAKAGVTEAS
jgi:hypothetical protein